MLRIAEDYDELARRAEKRLLAAKIQNKAEPIQWVRRSPTRTSKAEEYRQHAQECLDAVERIKDAEERAILFNIAQTWMSLAEKEDKKG